MGDETERESPHLRHLITSTAGHFAADILVSDIPSIFGVFVICRQPLVFGRFM